MRYRILYDPRVWEDDFKNIDASNQKRIVKAIGEKLGQHPNRFGKRLKGELKDFRSLRVGDYRVIYRVEEQDVIVLVVKVGHRASVYKKVLRRLGL